MATGQAQGLGDFKEYTSGQSDASTWTAAVNGFADWVQIIGAGSTVVTTEKGNPRTITTDTNEPATVIAGPFSALVSTTATRVRMGIGALPSAVAPANQIAVSPKEVELALSGTDGVLAEMPIPRPVPGTACTLVGAYLNMAAAAAASDTNYITLTLAKRDGAGGSATTLVAGTTKVTGGVNAGGGLLAFQEVSLGTPAATAIGANDVLTFKSAKTSSGVASGDGKLKLVFTVP